MGKPVKTSKYNWRQASLSEVCDWFQGKRRTHEVACYFGKEGDVTGLELDDTSVVLSASQEHRSTCNSDCSWLEPPAFWIGTLKPSK